jgi:hypothetical protein
MTEARIAAQIEGVEAHLEALPRWADELADVIAWIGGGSVLDRRRALQRVERIASEIGLSFEPLARLFAPEPGESGASEQTDRILISTITEPCDRCAGTGEVPIIVEVKS